MFINSSVLETASAHGVDPTTVSTALISSKQNRMLSSNLTENNRLLSLVAPLARKLKHL